MQSISKSIVIEYLELMIEKAELVILRNEAISSSNDFLTSPGKMEKFDAACMLIQVVGETAKKIDDWTNKQFSSIIRKCIGEECSVVGTSFHMNMVMLNPNKFLVSSRSICLNLLYVHKG